MKSFIAQIAGAVFISVVCEMIMPKGSVKKYVRLAIGFMMTAILLSPLSGSVKLPEIDTFFDGAYTKEELDAKSEAYVLDVHRRNIEKRAEELCGEGAKAYAEVFSDGRVKSVRIESGRDLSLVLPRLKKEFGCEDIEVLESDEDEN